MASPAPLQWWQREAYPGTARQPLVQELTLTCKGIRHMFVKITGVWLGKQDSSPRTW